MQFSNMVRKARTQRFSTARQFVEASGLSCSYGHYTDIESGKRNASGELAVEIVRVLRMPERESLFAWARDQMPDIRAKAAFSDDEDDAHPLKDLDPRDIALTNRHQQKILLEEPMFGDVAAYISLSGGASLADIAKIFGFTNSEADRILGKLFDNSIIDFDGILFKTLPMFYIPNEATELRKRQFEMVFKNVFSLPNPHNDIATIMLNEKDCHYVVSKIKKIIAWFFAMESKDKTPNCKPYTLGLFFGERPFGKEMR